MAKFILAFTRREPIEGGWSNEPEDDGNWRGAKHPLPNNKSFSQITNEEFNNIGLVGTNRGVTAPEYSKFLGHPATIEEMKAMPREHAISIFKPKYWDKMRGDEINDQDSANSIYDLCVNSGVSQGIVLCQRSLAIKETGVMDDFTMNKLNNKI